MWNGSAGKPVNHVAVGLCLGVAFGAAIGVALGNLAYGMGPGIALGVALGVVLKRKHVSRSAGEDREHSGHGS